MIFCFHSYKNEHENNASDLNQLTYSTVWSQGGPMIGAKPSADNWLKGVDTNLVPIDRSGEPLSFLITEKVLPELPTRILSKLEQVHCCNELIFQYILLY